MLGQQQQQQPQLAPGLSRKVKKLLETRVDAPDLADALKALSTFYDDNTPAARRGACHVTCEACSFLPG